MDDKVVVVANRAAEGLSALVRKHKEELAGAKEELKLLEKELAKEPS